jgi:Putative zinc-finger
VSNLDGERSLTAAIRELAAAAEHGLRDHPAPGELLDFVAGDLSAAERERIEEHLALCRDCARTALDLAADAESQPAPRGDLVTEKELAAEWERFRAAVSPALPVRRAVAMSRIAWVLAASLLLAVIGVSWRLGELAREVRRLSAPRSDVYVAELAPTGSGRPRERGEGDVVRPPAWVSRVVLILDFAGPASSPEYAVELATADGRPIWRRQGLRPGPDGTFTLEVPRDWLPPGTYRIRLLGLRGAEAREAARYELRVVPWV